MEWQLRISHNSEHRLEVVQSDKLQPYCDLLKYIAQKLHEQFFCTCEKSIGTLGDPFCSFSQEFRKND